MEIADQTFFDSMEIRINWRLGGSHIADKPKRRAPLKIPLWATSGFSDRLHVYLQIVSHLQEVADL